jgi:hypothetical protein
VLRSGCQWLFPRCIRAFVGTVAVLFGLQLSELQAEVVISNLPNTVTGGSTVSNAIWKAMLFTTGSSPTQLDSVVVGLNPPTGATPPITPQVKLSLFSVSGGNPAAELLTTGLVSVDMQALQGLYTFFEASPFALAANTQYALVVTSDTGAIKWGRNSNGTPTGSGGFQSNGFRQSLDSGGTWSTPGGQDNAVQISVVPEPGTMLLLGIGAAGSWGLAACRRRRSSEGNQHPRDGHHHSGDHHERMHAVAPEQPCSGC